MSSPSSKQLAREVARRRTFGIISHPDAGKTTLTEKMLLRGGAIAQAGEVKARKASRYATSDWMAMEKERGISVTSSVMQFPYAGRTLNLLDTPGHKDFSEDTYRVLTAVDSALMVLDNAAGVEPQTKKLMEVCRMRDMPILTFVNKMDRAGLDPLDLLDDIEQNLGLEAVPHTWPIGMGSHFLGTYHLQRHELCLYHGRDREEERVSLSGLDDPALDEHLGDEADTLRFDVELLSEAGADFDVAQYHAGTQTPVFFGSALNNFGLSDLLDTFVEIAPAPQPRPAVERTVAPTEEAFSGMVFKIQANMDPRHRDRIAFLRVCSGRYEHGMTIRHHRLEQDVRVGNATTFMAQDRKNVETAYPGDIIGLYNHGTIKIGDSFSTGEPLQFTGIPSFAPERFRKVHLDDPFRAKHLAKGLKQLSEEGAIQVFRPLFGNDVVLGAVGELQFDVTVERLDSEYNVTARLTPINVQCARWVEGPADEVDRFTAKLETDLYHDAEGDLAFLARNQWWLDRVIDEWPALSFHATKEHAIGLEAA